MVLSDISLVFYNIWIWTFISIIGIVVSNEKERYR
ncbi:hypothetical protein CLOBOL_06721 [Enterocloster bolteae ATCC BAA-613]|uniref:Uncharacterized protein n=1 Tax=Enterocloster bolteae (strain ATCC BAA-613 / DSM 15670 / CCUG 46953 / JCM 12243 / WAL 16351) TaxID=411902 RepID=A8S3T9_ENTBW|nr:hypothetical protein CLOBOL_06721 [Enterocloster bolteae ATCC BAA-613]